MTRKPVLLVDNSTESVEAKRLLDSERIEYLSYHVSKFEESCCFELPTTKAPAIFAPEGLFKGVDGVIEYIKQRSVPRGEETDSSYW